MSDSDDGGTNSADLSMPQSAQDKKRFLLQMLDRQAGGNVKQTFNFEEEDAVAPQLNGAVNKAGGEEPVKKQRGRPPRDRGAGNAAPVIEEADDDVEDNEDPDY